ncbi:hypothetical protein JCM15415_18510 [Methanobacterium movens]
MSVNLALVPLALAIRAIMGEKNFNEWVESHQLRAPTKIENKKDLVSCLNKAGYDAQEWGSSIKTHIDGEKEFFFWNFIEGRWVAIFSKTDSNLMIKKFMDNLESQNHQEIFLNIPEIERSSSLQSSNADLFGIEEPISMPSFEYPTNFNDEELLMKTLKEYDLEPFKENGDIICHIEDTCLKFNKIADEPFNVQIETRGNVKEMFDHLLILDEDYKLNVQSLTYEALKKNLADRDLSIDSEEVLKDDSIMITLNIDR